MRIKVLDLFSGIGGFSLGLESTKKFEIVAFCEIDPLCQAILRNNWPNVRIYDDVTDADFGEDVGLVTAGFPCQDISLAGKGAGISGERSGLFWYVIRALRMVGRPRLLLENVAGLLNRGLSTVLGALATFGYDAEWNCIPAGAVGAPHRRDRVWITAHDRSQRGEGVFMEEVRRELAFSWCEDVGRSEDIPERTHLYESKLCGGGHGVSKRLDVIGNAIVPQIASQLGEAIITTTKGEKQ